MLSKRAVWNPAENELTLVRAEAVRKGRALLDLTVSNPTTAGFAYPLDEIAGSLADGARQSYDPQPLGIMSAREAVARQAGADPMDVAITASTSEAYSFLFKLLCDAGDEVLTAAPSYPLLEHLASLEQIALRHFPLALHRRWEVERHLVAPHITPATKVIAMVSPNNPTGSYVTCAEQDSLASFSLPLISDEVFFDYALAPPPDAASLRRDDVLCFTLGGLSKSAGLPHLKLGWIIVSGPERERRAAVEALELVADNFLSVSTPVQHALPRLLELAPGIRAMLLRRIQANTRHLQHAIAAAPSLTLLPIEGGWTAVVRMPRVESEEETAIRLLRDCDVVVQPGYFFDFEADGYLALSLLTPEITFSEGVARIIATLTQ